MKNRIGIIFSLLLVVALMPSLVFAGNTSVNVNQNKNVTVNVLVGNVESNTNTNTVYSVDIEWSGFVFDWTYDVIEEKYGWSNYNVTQCEEVSLPANMVVSSQSGYYRNNTCTNAFSGTVATSGTYYRKVETGHEFSLTDKSTNGYVTPSLQWTPTTNYAFTTAYFKYEESHYCDLIDAETFESMAAEQDYDYIIYKNSSCTGTEYNPKNVTYQANTYYGYYHPGMVQFNGSEVPSSARQCPMGYEVINGVQQPCEESVYLFELNLGVDRTKTVRTPVKGETIGSLKIILTPHQN